MITNQTDPLYHTKHKMALGNKTPCNLKKAQKEQNVLYNGNVLYDKHDPPYVRDYDDTIDLAEESQNKMKQIYKQVTKTEIRVVKKQKLASYI